MMNQNVQTNRHGPKNKGCNQKLPSNYDDGDDEFRFNDASTHEGHLHQNGMFILFSTETAIIITSQVCIKL